MKTTLKKIVKQAVRKTGFDIVKVSPPRDSMKEPMHVDHKVPLLVNRMTNLMELGFSAPVIVDGGAHTGNWTKTIGGFFPASKFILIEPNPLVYSRIQDNLVNSGIDYTAIQKALGSQPGEFALNLWEHHDEALTGSSLCEHVRGAASKKIACELITLDSIIEVYQQVPNFVKLDLQGYELPALQGAKEILTHAELMLIEFGCLDAYINRTSIRDLIDVMYNHNYCLYDIIDMHYRPYDHALTGGDFMFVKNSSKLKQYKGWE